MIAAQVDLGRVVGIRSLPGRLGIGVGLIIAVIAISVLGYVTLTTSAEGEDGGSMVDRVDEITPDLERYIEDAMEKANVPAVAVGIVVDDRLTYSRGFGKGAQGQAIGDQTLFEIGSATKSFLGVTLAQLVDRDELGWDDHVREHYPGFRLSDPWVTREFRIYDLLAQRTGMAPYAADVLSLLGYEIEDSIAAVADISAISSFRSEFAYQNVPHLVASEIVAEKTGHENWNEAVQEELLGPLGMKASGTSPGLLTESEDSTRGHQLDKGELRTVVPVSLPENVFGAGSIISNVDDMAKWVSFQLGRGEIGGKRLLSEEQHRETWQPRVAVTGEFADRMAQVPGKTGLSYATGWFLHSVPEGRIIEHGGTTLGYTSAIRLDPDRRVGIVVLTNQSAGGGIALPISKYAFDLIQGREARDHVEAMVQLDDVEDQTSGATDPDAVIRDLVGVYRHPVGGRMEITRSGGKLVTALGPKRIDAEIEIGDGRVGALTWKVDNEPDGPVMSAPLFYRHTGGPVAEVILADLPFRRSE